MKKKDVEPTVSEIIEMIKKCKQDKIVNHSSVAKD